MKSITQLQLRDEFISFWGKRGHVEIPPIPLVPKDDPTTLFTGSGMQQLVPYLTTGKFHPLGKRLYNIQPCIRSQDIEEVGDNSHTTFFEMLGNWSLGDYFKQDQLSWFWEFLTKNLNLPKEKLHITVFEGENNLPKDEESALIWKSLGITSDHIHFYSAEKNWWSRSGTPEKMPIGEIGGPDSEVFYDFDPENKLHIHEQSKYASKLCHPNCNCGRFLEIGNCVFMEYVKTQKGFQPLPNKNVDFGGGLERILAALNQTPDIFQIDLFKPIISSVEEWTNQKYENEKKRLIRIIADHLKAATFLIADGIEPSNKDRGYVLRRLLRRSGIMIHLLGGSLTSIPSLTSICDAIVSVYRDIYFSSNPEQLKKHIETLLEKELISFGSALDRGLKLIQRTPINGITPQFAFNMYQSYGFPFEILQELLLQKDVNLSKKEFDEEFEKHRQISKQGAEKKFKGGLADTSENSIKLHTATHLLHHALRETLGKEVQQKGSNITPDRLRFDFSYSRKVTDQEKNQIEKTVNTIISQHLDIWQEHLPKAQAEKLDALAFFGEKYGKTISVYFVGKKPNKETAVSKEFCGGPHVENTKSLGIFVIAKEESAGAGTRRIYAILK